MKKLKVLIFLISLLLVFVSNLSASFFNNQLAFFHGIKDAKEDIDQNIFQQLYIGEPAPLNYLDPKTGLPAISLGCEYTKTTEIYANSYNNTVQRYIEIIQPFPESLIIEYNIIAAGLNHTLTLYFDKAILDNGDSEIVFSPDKATIYKIGILTLEIMGIQVPANVVTSQRLHYLNVKFGDKEWNISGAYNSPYIPKELIDALELLRNSSL